MKEIRQALREHRGKLGHIRRLADASTKRVAVEAVADKATASVHRFVEFSLKVCFRFLFFLRAGCLCVR